MPVNAQLLGGAAVLLGAALGPVALCLTETGHATEVPARHGRRGMTYPHSVLELDV